MGGVNGVRAVVETLAVKRVHESGGIADTGPAVAAYGVGMIGQMGVSAHIGADGYRLCEKQAPDGMLIDMRKQAFGDVDFLGRGEEAGIVSEAERHITVLQGDDPAPPAATHQVIGGAVARGAHSFGEAGMRLRDFVAVEVANAAKARPHRAGGVGIELAPVSQFPG